MVPRGDCEYDRCFPGPGKVCRGSCLGDRKECQGDLQGMLQNVGTQGWEHWGKIFATLPMKLIERRSPSRAPGEVWAE